MDWRFKAIGYRTLRWVPYAETLRYWIQRRLTGRLPRKLHPTGEIARWFDLHRRAFSPIDPHRAVHFEFGAGWDLYSPLFLWCHGVDTQHVVDLTTLAKADLVNAAIEALSEDPPELALRMPTVVLRDRDSLRSQLRCSYGIRYIAPGDARHTDLATGSVDLVSSTNTLEHVAPPQIRQILKELRRVTHRRSILSMVIDYTDHYSHTDSKIEALNFLRYPEWVWKLLNPPMHYQNRLRHSDYHALFERAGFEVAVQTRFGSDSDVSAELPVAARFRRYPREDLLTTAGHFVLRRA